jgi:hypothetical protein
VTSNGLQYPSMASNAGGLEETSNFRNKNKKDEKIKEPF